MNDFKKNLQEYIDYRQTYWYHKMKAFEHMSKEADCEWEKCFDQNNIIIGLSKILKNEEIVDQLLEYGNYGIFYIHAHNRFECGENTYPKPYGETYKDINIESIKAFYDWLEKDR